MSLKQILADVAAQGAKRMPPEAIATMEKATADYIAAGIGKNAPGIGDTLPDATLMDATGKPVRLSNLLTKGPLILNFYRGGWCPYCNFEMKAYQDLLPEITAAGATLVGVTPEKPDNALSTAEKNALTYPVLSDTGNAFAKALGIAFELEGDLKNLYQGFGLDLPNLNAQSGWSLPIPAVYVVGSNGKILFADVDLDYRRRAEPSEAVAALKAA
jgi:peroxiredoxin